MSNLANLDLDALLAEWAHDAPDAAPEPLTLDDLRASVEQMQAIVTEAFADPAADLRATLGRVEFRLDGLNGLCMRLAAGA